MLSALPIKKITGLILLGVMLFPLFTIATLLLQKQYVVHRMKAALETASLQQISLNQQDIQWVKKDKELRVNNKLFDVRSSIRDGNRVHFTGLFDEEETAIEKKLKDLSTGSGSSRSGIITQLLSLLQQVFIDSSFFNLKTNIPVLTPLFSGPGVSLVQLAKTVLTPPPRS